MRRVKVVIAGVLVPLAAATVLGASPASASPASGHSSGVDSDFGSATQSATSSVQAGYGRTIDNVGQWEG